MVRLGTCIVLVACLCLLQTVHGACKKPIPMTKKDTSCRARKSLEGFSCKKKIAHRIGEVFMDIGWLHRNIISQDTLKIIAAFIPPYLVARMNDEKVQCKFYSKACHKNKNQLPDCCRQIAKHGIAVPMVGLSSLGLFAQNEDLRATGRITGIALPFVLWTKDALKKLQLDCCYRPWNERFSCKKRAYGGCPSGHMSEATFLAALWGARHGLPFGIPLGLFAGGVFIEFINCNRHYPSQLVAGAGLGIIYAVAANKLVDQKLGKNLSVDLISDRHGMPGLQLSYVF